MSKKKGSIKEDVLLEEREGLLEEGQQEQVAQEESSAADVQQSSDTEVSFDAWFVLRSSHIPAHHKKEIIRADFSARGVGDSAKMSEFDEALRKYGIDIK